MNMLLISEILKTRRVLFILLAILVLANILMLAYEQVYLSPHLANLQNQWFEKRRLASSGAMVGKSAIYQQGTKDLAVWNSRIPAKKEFARVLGELFETASSNSLIVSGVTYKPETIKGEKLLAYAINFKLTGKYGAVKSFIIDLSRLKEILVIDNLALSNGKATEEAVSLDLKLTAYFKVEGE